MERLRGEGIKVQRCEEMEGVKERKDGEIKGIKGWRHTKMEDWREQRLKGGGIKKLRDERWRCGGVER